MKRISSDHYYAEVRTDVLEFLAPGPYDRVLELGCGEGATAAAAKASGLVKWVAGIELVPSVADIARTHLDDVWSGDVEHMAIPVEDNSLDAVLCLDVLEHLRDPWAVVAALHRKIKVGGILVASIPNLRHRSVMKDLLFNGNFEYTESGILDRTHLRFFTRKTAIELMTGSGLEMVKIRHLGAEKVARRWRGRWLVNCLTLGRAEDFYTRQFLIMCRKTAAT